MTNSFNDLLPCPFCGHNRISLSYLMNEDDRRTWYCEVECNRCEAKIRRGISWNTYVNLGDDAESYLQHRCIDAWNNRHASQQELDSRETLQKIEQQLDQILSKDTNQIKLDAQQWAINNPEAALEYLSRLEDS